MKKPDKIAKLNTIGARRDACGYRVQETTCASCVHVARNIHAQGHAAQMIEAQCARHNFPVNLDRGVCDDFARTSSRWRPRAPRKTITRRSK